MQNTKIMKALNKYKTENMNKYGILSLGVFGSVARGDTNETSDINVVIDLKEPDLFKMVHIKDELEALLHKNVDIVRNRKTMNPYLKKRIERDAV